MTVRKTMIRLAWSLNIHIDSNILIEEYKNPIKNNSHGFFSAFNGLIKDSSTIGAIFLQPVFIVFDKQTIKFK